MDATLTAFQGLAVGASTAIGAPRSVPSALPGRFSEEARSRKQGTPDPHQVRTLRLMRQAALLTSEGPCTPGLLVAVKLSNWKFHDWI